MPSTLETLTSYLPQDQGLLPKWLLFISLVSLTNSLQAYTSQTASRIVYAGRPAQVTPLSARTFGTWTAITAIVRLYAAYNITNKVVYDLALWTFVVAWGHFFGEWVVFGTAKWGRGLVGPVVVATGTGVWMWGVRGGYGG